MADIPNSKSVVERARTRTITSLVLNVRSAW